MVNWSWKQGTQEILSPVAPECHLLATGGHYRSDRNLTCPVPSLRDYTGPGGSVETPQGERDNNGHAMTVLRGSWKSRQGARASRGGKGNGGTRGCVRQGCGKRGQWGKISLEVVGAQSLGFVLRVMGNAVASQTEITLGFVREAEMG